MLMRARHRLNYSDKDTFGFVTADAINNFVQALFGIIAAVALGAYTVTSVGIGLALKTPLLGVCAGGGALVAAASQLVLAARFGPEVEPHLQPDRLGAGARHSTIQKSAIASTGRRDRE